jgi:hypothetical protein
MLGAEWIASATRGKGIAPFMDVASMGLLLEALDGIGNSDHLLEHLRRDDQGARAELFAIYLFKSRDSSLTVELQPQVGNRKADFRIRKGDEPWTTVEVTRSLASEEEKRVFKVIELPANALSAVDRQFSLHLVLSRKLTTGETSWLCPHLLEFCGGVGPQQATLIDDMGYVFLNHVKAGRIQVPEVAELAGKPKVGLIVLTGGGPNGGPRSQVSVQIVFSDERGDEILKREAKQLPLRMGPAW